MRVRTLLITGVAVVVVGVLVGIGAAVFSTVADRAGTDTSASAAPKPSAESTAKPKGAVPKKSQPPPSARPTPTFDNYVALGDSYAAGMGGGGEHGRCLRSKHGYPYLLSKPGGPTLQRNIACSGATTADVQRHQLSALSKETNLVTLSVGGNDLDVAALAAACADGVTHKCQTKFRASLTLLEVLPDRLAATYSAVADAAPNARIVVTGYPLMFLMPSTDSPDFSTVAFANAATASMDQVIKNAVKKKRADGAEISYVPIDFTGHEIGNAQPWINPSGPTAFHPTAAGYEAMAKAVRKKL